jgi:hypothetical protein
MASVAKARKPELDNKVDLPHTNQNPQPVKARERES